MNPSLYDTLTATEAISYQKELQVKINVSSLDKQITTIGGSDISFNKCSEVVYAGIIVFSYPELKVIERSTVISKTKFPYISGLLAFREVPALLEAWDKLKITPDVLVLDGQGIAHERRLGIAIHFGIIADTPTIGCAKSRLAGRYKEPANEVFAKSPMYDKGELIGTALKTKKNCKPVFISPGNMIDMEQSVDLIKNCLRGYRIPEPTRQAHLIVNQIRINDRNEPGLQCDLFS